MFCCWIISQKLLHAISISGNKKEKSTRKNAESKTSCIIERILSVVSHFIPHHTSVTEEPFPGVVLLQKSLFLDSTRFLFCYLQETEKRATNSNSSNNNITSTTTSYTRQFARPQSPILLSEPMRKQETQKTRMRYSRERWNKGVNKRCIETKQGFPC